MNDGLSIGLSNISTNTITINNTDSACCTGIVNIATSIGPSNTSDYLAEVFKAAGISTEKKKTRKEIDLENRKAFEKLDPVKKVFFNEGRLGWATTVFWKDGTKTTVVCDSEDEFSQEVGIAMCFMKKQMGNKGNYNNVFRKWCVETNTDTEIKGQQRL